MIATAEAQAATEAPSSHLPFKTLALAVLAPFAAIGLTALPLLLETALRGLTR
ncbi:MAG TPA: hypothetical protein VGL99_06980 [Chloroflexota bacterium]|jgi:hypothetical protein